MQIKYIPMVAGFIATGLLVKIAMNTSDIKTELNVVTGKVTVLEQNLANVKKEVEQVKQIQSLLIQTDKKLVLSQTERQCLIKNIYHEAGVEPMEGKIAVAQTTLNRVNAKRWKNTICGVVHQRAQFSWTLSAKKKHARPRGKLWDESVLAAERFEKGTRVRGLKEAKFYHTDYIKTPKWADRSKMITQIGQHIFYTEDAKS